MFHVLPNIARSKGNQTVKFGKLKNIPCDTFCFKNHAENGMGRLVPDLFVF